MTSRPALHLPRRHSAAPARPSGFSLIELTVVLVILGVMGILLVRWIGMDAADRSHATQRDLLQRSDDALIAFAAIQARLPCPDADGDGREDCAGALAVGALPYVTLGLPDRRASGIRYSVLRRTGGVLTVPDFDGATWDMAPDADLAALQDRAMTLQVISNSPNIEPAHQIRLWNTCNHLPAGSPTCDDLPQLRTNGLDMCDALRSASLLPTSAGFVHTLREDGSGEIAGNVAYALAIPDTLNPAPLHTGTSLAFHSPRRPAGGADHYQDKVHAVGLDQLWTRLRCGESYGPAIYAHANVAVAARLTTPAMHNYVEQLEIMLDLARANDDSADAGLVSAAAQITSATAGVLDTIGETFETYGAWNWRVAVATAGIGTAVGGMIAAAVMKGFATTYKNRADNLLTEFKSTRDFPGMSQTLETAIQAEAQRADMLGIYPDAAARHAATQFGAATTP